MVSIRTWSLSILTGAVILMSPLAATSQTASPLYLFIYRPGPAWKPGVPMAGQDLRPHGAYMAKLDAEGRILAAGGFPDQGGMAIVRAASLEEAQRLLAADPAVTSGVFLADLRAWKPRFGDLPRSAPDASALN
jgi:uncharacterized protein YciI